VSQGSYALQPYIESVKKEEPTEKTEDEKPKKKKKKKEEKKQPKISQHFKSAEFVEDSDSEEAHNEAVPPPKKRKIEEAAEPSEEPNAQRDAVADDTFTVVTVGSYPRMHYGVDESVPIFDLLTETVPPESRHYIVYGAHHLSVDHWSKIPRVLPDGSAAVWHVFGNNAAMPNPLQSGMYRYADRRKA
jgi:hypothetical protein